MSDDDRNKQPTSQSQLLKDENAKDQVLEEAADGDETDPLAEGGGEPMDIDEGRQAVRGTSDDSGEPGEVNSDETDD